MAFEIISTIQCVQIFISALYNLERLIFVFFPLPWKALSVTETLIKPLERFRKEQLGAVKVC